MARWNSGSTLRLRTCLVSRSVYEQMSATRRIRLHRQIGEREEQAYGDRAREIAAELAVHFERGRDTNEPSSICNKRARMPCGVLPIRKQSFSSPGAPAAQDLAGHPERVRQELTLQLALNDALIPTKGYAAPEVEKTVHPGPGTVPAAGGDFSALPSAVETDACFIITRGSYRRHVSWGSSCCV